MCVASIQEYIYFMLHIVIGDYYNVGQSTTSQFLLQLQSIACVREIVYFVHTAQDTT